MSEETVRTVWDAPIHGVPYDSGDEHALAELPSSHLDPPDLLGCLTFAEGARGGLEVIHGKVANIRLGHLSRSQSERWGRAKEVGPVQSLGELT